MLCYIIMKKKITGLGIIVHATITERPRLQFFHIEFGVIVHATISERCRLQGLVLSFMPR